MPIFTYKLRSEKGQLISGTVQATTQADAQQMVKKLKGTLIEMTEAKPETGRRFRLFRRISLRDKIIFTQQLAVMLNAGVTLLPALKGLGEETLNRNLSEVIQSMVDEVEGGKPLSDALAHHPKIFSQIYYEMIRSAEKTGNLAGILDKLTIQLQKEYDLRSKVKGALIYPVIVFSLLIAVVIVVITFILPKLTGLFVESNISLPLSTRILLGISDLFVHKWYLLLGVSLGLIVALKLAIRTKRGHRIWDNTRIHLPILGNFLRKTYMARFTQSFASLAQAGIPVLDVFKTLRGIMDNVIYEEEIDKISADVENGIKVSVAIRRSKYFPGVIGQLVSVGEQSGDLAGIFTVLGDFFEKEVDNMAKNLSTLLEPLIMILMGVAIGFVLISILQPIFNLVNVV